MRPFALVTSLVLCVSFAHADDKPAPPADPAALEKAWVEFGTPGKEHEMLQKLAGTWNTTTTEFHDGKTLESKGRAKFESIHGGRFVRQSYEGTMGGQKFTGTGVTGYDKAKKKFVGAWIDSMGTGIMRFEGTYDTKTHTLTETGISSSPVGDMKWKIIHDYKSADEFLMTMFMQQGEAEIKMLEITYTRKK